MPCGALAVFQDRRLPRLKQADALWIGCEISGPAGEQQAVAGKGLRPWPPSKERHIVFAASRVEGGPLKGCASGVATAIASLSGRGGAFRPACTLCQWWIGRSADGQLWTQSCATSQVGEGRLLLAELPASGVQSRLRGGSPCKCTVPSLQNEGPSGGLRAHQRFCTQEPHPRYPVNKCRP